MTFWKELYLDAYYSKIYSLEYLKEKLKTLKDQEKQWKKHPDYSSYKKSVNGLIAAINHIENELKGGETIC